MSKSPTRGALQLSLAFALLSGAWVIFNHYGPHILMVIDENLVHHDEPADMLFAAVSSLMLFFVVRRYLAAQEQVQATLSHSRNELEVRVQERTYDLHTERNKLRRILDAMPDGVCIISQNYELNYVNPTMEQAWRPVAERKCYAYFADRQLPCPDCRLAQIGAKQTLRWEWHVEQSQKIYEVVGAALNELDSDTATLYIFHDVTEQALARRKIEEMGKESAHQAEALRLAHAELSERAHQLAALLEISHTMASTLELQPLLEVILDQMK
ncbi:PAS domain-containing protein, partial [Caldilinea sp.]|uniref:PAS domain-containing protein n=1 Tax=Caldilinea sp. TaxID=2293560 RepID=UPI002BDD84FB|nr:PAS domain-containing protein [Caldilinea sp.]